MLKSALWLGVFMALAFCCAGSGASIIASDEIVVSANARTPAEFGNGTTTSACVPATVAVCFNPIDQFVAESSGESTFSSLIGFRSGSNANGNGHSATFNTAVELLDPNTGAISDIIELQIVGNTGTGADQQWTLVFTSDAEGGAPLTTPPNLVGPAFTLTETGLAQDISGDFLNSDGTTRITPLFTITVTSDVEVPEPSGIVLFGTALIAVGFLRHRRRS